MSISAPQASVWLQRFISLIPQCGEVLDLASGGGRNCASLVSSGHRVLAVDRDQDLLARAAEAGAATLCLDLETANFIWPFAPQRFAGIVICNYLHRPLFSQIVAGLAPDGVLLIETFSQGNEQFGRPSNPNFLLAPGELLGLVNLADGAGLHVVAYENGYVDNPKPAIVQRICIKKSLRTLASLDMASP